MEILVSALVLIVSFALMAKVVDGFFLSSLDNIANWLKMSPSVAGATLMAFGTSAPEISTTMFAVFLAGANPATGLGTVVGSAIFQILVVIGFATIVRSAYLDWKPVMRDGAFYVVAIVVLIVVVNDDVITRLESSLMVGAYICYLIMLWEWNKHFREPEFEVSEVIEEELTKQKSKLSRSPLSFLYKMIVFPIDYLFSFVPNLHKSKNVRFTIPVFLFSLFLIAFLSYWLVIAAENLAIGLGVPTAIVALTILAGGTSIPEVISSAIVSKQGRGDMAISNAIGSNVFDILMSLGFPVFCYTWIHGDLEGVGKETINSSILLLFATMITVIVLMISLKFKLGRGFGVILIFVYVLYVLAAYGGLL